jgi:hypothetical protein
MYLDPVFVQWAIIFGASFCAYMIGKKQDAKERNDTIEDTITYLCEEGYIRHKESSDGEILIMPWNTK